MSRGFLLPVPESSCVGVWKGFERGRGFHDAIWQPEELGGGCAKAAIKNQDICKNRGESMEGTVETELRDAMPPSQADLREALRVSQVGWLQCSRCGRVEHVAARALVGDARAAMRVHWKEQKHNGERGRWGPSDLYLSLRLRLRCCVCGLELSQVDCADVTRARRNMRRHFEDAHGLSRGPAVERAGRLWDEGVGLTQVEPPGLGEGGQPEAEV